MLGLLTGCRPPVAADYFGLHVGDLGITPPDGFPPVPAGSVRMWDTLTTWRHVETTPGVFDWSRADLMVRTAEEHDATVVLALGQTPTFHAVDPAAPGAFGEGATSMPRLDAWRRYVRAAVDRYGTRVAYQVWNEPNISNYWSGTQAQMVTLTREASRIIRGATDGKATVVAPSYALRLPYQQKKFEAYWTARPGGKPVADLVDVVAVHLYPLAEELPEDTEALLAFARTVLADADAGDLPIWNAEINYGLEGGAPPTFIPEELQIGFVLRTYLLNAAWDVDRVYWYRWDILRIANTYLTEEDRVTPTRVAQAYRTVQRWLVGATMLGCSTDADGVSLCAAASADGDVLRFYWQASGPGEVRLPAGAREWEDWNGDAHRVERRRLDIGPVPVMVRSAR